MLAASSRPVAARCCSRLAFAAEHVPLDVVPQGRWNFVSTPAHQELALEASWSSRMGAGSTGQPSSRCASSSPSWACKPRPRLPTCHDQELHRESPAAAGRGEVRGARALTCGVRRRPAAHRRRSRRGAKSRDHHRCR